VPSEIVFEIQYTLLHPEWRGCVNR